MDTHSVENHLRLQIKDYDVAIRTLVPYYDEHLSTGTDILKRLTPNANHIIDLGCGTGRLAQAVLQKMPEAQLELLDIDPKTLDQAALRFGQDNKRIKFSLGSFH